MIPMVMLQKDKEIPVVTIRWRCLSKNKKFDNYILI